MDREKINLTSNSRTQNSILQALNDLLLNLFSSSRKYAVNEEKRGRNFRGNRNELETNSTIFDLRSVDPLRRPKGPALNARARVHVRQRDDRNLSIHVWRYNMRIGSDIKNDEWWLAEGYTPLDDVFLPALSSSFFVFLCITFDRPSPLLSSPSPWNFVLRILMFAKNLSPLTRRKENV